MKKVLIRGPLLTNSGYGVHSRQVFKWLNSLENIDLNCQILPWGNNPWILDKKYDDCTIEKIVEKSINQNKIITTKFDESYQIQMPNEWIRISKKDVGITAGIESNYCNKSFISDINKMDQVIVPSIYASDTFKNTARHFGISLNKIEVVPESFPDLFNKEIKDNNLKKLDIKTEFNFLIFGQLTSFDRGSDRKNTLKTLESILKVFFNNKDIGIIVKTNLGNNSKIDKNHCINLFKSFIDSLNIHDRKCKIYILHNNLTELEIYNLYSNVNVLVSGSRAEGFGLTHLEASSLGIPIISTGYSGYEDFLQDKYLKVEYDLVKVKNSSNIFEKSLSCWAEFKDRSMQENIKEIYENFNKYKSISKNHKKTIKQNYNLQSIINSYRSIARV
jgi:glycosyltransferase involved in cell wall biosynthesis